MCKNTVRPFIRHLNVLNNESLIKSPTDSANLTYQMTHNQDQLAILAITTQHQSHVIDNSDITLNQIK